MHVKELYTIWAEKQTLTETELRRVTKMAVRGGDTKLLYSILSQESCTEEIVDLMKESGNPGVLGVLLRSRRRPEADFAWLLTLQSEIVVATLECMENQSLSTEQLELLWATGEPRLRLAALERVSWHHRTPKAWGTWLLRMHQKGKLPGTPKEVFHSLGLHAPESAWETVSKSAQLDVLLWTYCGIPEDQMRERYTERALQRIKEYLDQGAPGKHHVCVTDALAKMLSQLRDGTKYQKGGSVAGSVEVELTLRLLQHLPDRSSCAMELREFLPEDLETGNEPLTRDEILAALRGGELPGTALESALEGNGSHDEVWEKVATHPKLRPSEAATLMRKLDRYNQRDEVEVILRGRKGPWMVELGRICWGWEQYLAEQTKKVFRQIPAGGRSKLLEELARKSPRNIERMVEYHLDTHRLLGLVRADSLHEVGENTRHALLRLTRSHLGESEVAWEIFETLAGDCTTTYGELLEAVSALAGEKSA